MELLINKSFTRILISKEFNMFKIKFNCCDFCSTECVFPILFTSRCVISAIVYFVAKDAGSRALILLTPGKPVINDQLIFIISLTQGSINRVSWNVSQIVGRKKLYKF